MRLTISTAVNPGGFSENDIVAVKAEVAMPELADYKAAKGLSGNDVAALNARFESGIAELREKVGAELALLGRIAHERERAEAAKTSDAAERASL